MITFYEGLPRAGKSYSAVKDEICGALKSGRSVVAYIEGLDSWAVASYVGGDRPAVLGLLRVLARDEVANIWKLDIRDALVVIDEAQNFWPSGGGKNKLPDGMQQWIAEHGHMGLDVVLLGQSMKDMHPLFRRRIERKYYFLKKSAIGQPDKFSCTISTVIPKGNDVELVPIQTISAAYDAAIFPLYASHEAGTQNKETAVDQRAVIWNHPLFRRWLPLAGVVFVGLAFYVWSLFHGGLEKSALASAGVKPGQTADTIKPVPIAAAAPVNTVPSAGTRPAEYIPLDAVDELNSKGRIRLVGYVAGVGETRGFVEWRDGANNLLQSMSFRDLAGLGWAVLLNTSGTYAIITKGSRQLTAMAWTIDRADGRASETQLAKVSGSSLAGVRLAQ